MKVLVNIINHGLYDVEVSGDEVHVNPAFIYTWDGEFWTVDVSKDEDEPIQIPTELKEDESFDENDLWDVMTCLVLPYLGCPSDESWMDIAQEGGDKMYDGLIAELTMLMDLNEEEIMQLEDILEGNE